MTRFLLFTVVTSSVVLGQERPSRAWAVLEEGLHSTSADTRAKATRSLGLITHNARARQFGEKALADENESVRAAAAEALGSMGAKSSAPKLVEAAKSKDTSVVFAAANALYVLGDPRAYEVYYAVLMGERKSGDSLMESQLKMVKDPKALAKMGFESGIGFIPFAGIGYSVFKTVTKDDASPIRAAAAQKLIKDPDPKTNTALIKAAGDPKWLVRASVVDAIAKRGDPALLRAVWPLLDDTNETVRFVAAAAIIHVAK